MPKKYQNIPRRLFWGQNHAYVAACTPSRHVESFTSQHVRPYRSADGEHSLTATLSDAHGEESPRVVTDTEEVDTDDGSGNITQSSPRNAKSGSIKTGHTDNMISPDRPPGACESTPPEHNGATCAAGERSPGTAPDGVGPKGVHAHDRPVRPGEEGSDGTARGPGIVGGEEEDGAAASENASTAVEGGVSIDEVAVGSCDGAGGGEGGNEPPTPGAVVSGAGDGSARRPLTPEDALRELSRAGQKALDGDEDDDSDEVLEAGGGGAIGGTNLARSLFGDACIVRAGGAHRVAGGGEEPVLGAEAGCHEVGVVFVALSREPIKIQYSNVHRLSELFSFASRAWHTCAALRCQPTRAADGSAPHTIALVPRLLRANALFVCHLCYTRQSGDRDGRTFVGAVRGRTEARGKVGTKLS